MHRRLGGVHGELTAVGRPDPGPSSLHLSFFGAIEFLYVIPEHVVLPTTSRACRIAESRIDLRRLCWPVQNFLVFTCHNLAITRPFACVALYCRLPWPQ